MKRYKAPDKGAFFFPSNVRLIFCNICMISPNDFSDDRKRNKLLTGKK